MLSIIDIADGTPLRAYAQLFPLQKFSTGGQEELAGRQMGCSYLKGRGVASDLCDSKGEPRKGSVKMQRASRHIFPVR